MGIETAGGSETLSRRLEQKAGAEGRLALGQEAKVNGWLKRKGESRIPLVRVGNVVGSFPFAHSTVHLATRAYYDEPSAMAPLRSSRA